MQKSSQMGRNRAFSLLKQKEVATWSPWRQRIIQSFRRSPLGRHGDRKSQKCIRWIAILGSLKRPTLANGDLTTLGKVAIYGRHSDLLMQVATSSRIAHGRHLLNGEKDGVHGDLCI